MNDTRRDFLKTGALAGAAIAGGVSLAGGKGRAGDENEPDSGKLSIKVAGYRYDRVDGLIDGRVPVSGCNVRFEAARIGEMNTHVFSGSGTREVTEIGLLPFMLAFANEEFRDYALIPVFPLRLFRHKSIFVRTDARIETPEDLRGRKIATPGYSSTSLTWIRGIMRHEYGVKSDEIRWVVSSKDSSAKASGGASKFENVLPSGIAIEKGPKGKDESDMLVDGDVDALFHAAQPRAFVEGHPNVRRLFPDYRRTERAYYAKTGVFPIMHAVAIKKEVIRANPWLPKAVFDAYSSAKQLAYNYMKNSAWYADSLPWIGQEFEETRKLMGDNYWSYGIDANRTALEAIFQYAHEQGLAGRKLSVEELFHPSTLELNEDGA